jgi:hypothetical protein
MRFVPLILSSLLIAAHFYRGEHFVLSAIAVAAPLILLVRRPWAVATLQVALFVAGAEWIRTALAIGAMRAAMGEPATRMFIILTAVALFTVLSAIPLNGRRTA